MDLIFAVLTPFITWVYDLHLVHCELLPSRVFMLRIPREHQPGEASTSILYKTTILPTQPCI